MAIRTTGVRYDVIARDSASKVFKGVGNSASKLDGGLGKLAKTAAYAGAALAGGLAAGMAVSAEKSVKFQAEMLKVSTQAGGTAKDVGILSKQVLQLGKTTQQGPEKLAGSLYHLKSVGMDNVDAMKALKTSSDLAALGGADLEATTNALAGAWRTGIRGATDFTMAASTVNAIIGAGNMRMEDFVAAIGTGFLPSAKTFGLGLNQVGAALALMTDEGVDAASAATRLRMTFSLLGAPSAAAEKQLKKIHLTGLQLATAMRGPDGLIGAVGLLRQRLDASGLSTVKQSQLLSRAFGGGRSSSAILTLVNNFDVLKKKQDQVNNSMGKYGPAVQAQRKTVAAQLNILKSNLDVFAIQAGNKLLPPITSFVTYLNKTAIPEAGRFGTALAGMVPVGKIEAGFSATTSFISDFFTGLSKKKPVITLPTPTIKAPSTVIPNTLRRPDLIVPTPTLKVATTPIPGTLKAPAAVKSQARKLGKQLRTLISGGIGDAVGTIDWGKLGKNIGGGLGRAFGWVTAHGSGLSKKLAKAIAGVDWTDIGKDFGSLAVPLAIGFVDNLFAPLFTTSFWKKHWLDTIIAVLSVLPVDQVFSAVGKGFGKLPWGRLGSLLDHVPWGRIFAWPRWIGSTLGGAQAEAGRFVGRLATGFGEAFTRQFPRVGRAFSDQLYVLPDRLGDLGRVLNRKATDLVKSFGARLVKVPLLGNGFVKAVGKFFGRYTFYQTGIHLTEGLLSGAAAKMAGIGKWIKTHLVDPVVNWTKSLFGIHSPSTIFRSIGGQLIAGLLGGVLAAITGVGKWLYSHVVSPVKGAFGGAGGWLYGRGQALVGGLLDGVWSVGRGMGDWVTGHIAEPILGAFNDAGSWLYHKGLDVMSGLLSGLERGFRDVSGYLGDVGSTISKSVSGAASGIKGALRKLPGFASGGVAPIGQTAWVGERGPELMQVTGKGTRIFSNRDSMALARTIGMQIPGYASGTVNVGAARSDVAQAQREVTRMEKQIAALRKDEATAHTRRQRKADQLAIMAEEERLKAARTELTRAKKELTAAEQQAKRVQGIANTLQNGFLKSLETSTAAGIASAIKSLNSKLQSAGFGNLVAGNLKTSSRLQALAAQRASVQSQIATATQYASDQSGSLGDYLALSNTPSASISSLISRMQARQSTAAGFASEVAGLSQRGLNKNLLSQLADAGPGSQLAALLSKATAGDIAQLNKLAVSQQKLTASFGQTMADAMYDSGSQAGLGFLSGLKAQEKQLQAEMDKLALGMVTTLKKKLGIKSPSSVTRDQIGKPFALGAGLGVRIYTPHAVREAQRMADTMAAVRARGGAVPVAAGNGGGQAVHHHHETHYTINARTADYTVAELELLQRKSEARQRVGRPR